MEWVSGSYPPTKTRRSEHGWRWIQIQEKLNGQQPTPAMKLPMALWRWPTEWFLLGQWPLQAPSMQWTQKQGLYCGHITPTQPCTVVHQWATVVFTWATVIQWAWPSSTQPGPEEIPSSRSALREEKENSFLETLFEDFEIKLCLSFQNCLHASSIRWFLFLSNDL